MPKRVSVFILRPRSGFLAVVFGLALLLVLRGAAMREQLQQALAPSLFGVSLVIDAGHGGADPGMVGDAVLEKDVNLTMAQILSDYCRSAGADVTMTRESDASLSNSIFASLSPAASKASLMEA